MRAWDVDLGRGGGDIVIENSYVDVTDASSSGRRPRSTPTGAFSLGYPAQGRRRGDQRAHPHRPAGRWTICATRSTSTTTASTGMLSGEFHLYGNYTTPYGFGTMTIDEGIAYGEPFETATASLRFEGAGVRLDGIEIRKGGGRGHRRRLRRLERHLLVQRRRAAGFPSRRVAVAAVSAGAAVRAARLHRQRQRHVRRRRATTCAAASATCSSRDEGIGEVTGRLDVRDDDARPSSSRRPRRASPCRAPGASRSRRDGRRAHVPLHRHVARPVRARVPAAALAVHDRGRQRHAARGRRAAQPRSARRGRTRRSAPAALVRLRPAERGADPHRARSAVVAHRPTCGWSATTPARLWRHRRPRTTSGWRCAPTATRTSASSRASSATSAAPGRPTLTPTLDGTARQARLSRAAPTIADGRLRHFALPHSLEAINGASRSTARRRLDGLTARLGGGAGALRRPHRPRRLRPGRARRDGDRRGHAAALSRRVALGGRRGLALRGHVRRAAAERRRHRAERGLHAAVRAATATCSTSSAARTPERAAAGAADRDSRCASTCASSRRRRCASRTTSRGIVLERRPHAARHLRPAAAVRPRRDRARRGACSRASATWSRAARSTSATRRGSSRSSTSRPRRGSRVPGQTYRVTAERCRHDGPASSRALNSDPPLPTVDILSLLLERLATPTGCRAARSCATPRADRAAAAAGARRALLVSPISAERRRAWSSRPSASTRSRSRRRSNDPAQQSSRLNPGARLTIGKRISDRALPDLLAQPHAASTSRDQIILLEYDQSDRLSWVLSQNEDRTYALEVRVRHAF